MIRLLLILIFVNAYTTFAQCGCPGNSTEIGLISMEELYKLNEAKSKNMFVNLIFKNTYADTYFEKDKKIGKGPIKFISSNYTNLRLSFKPIDYLIIESDIGYFINRKQSETLFDNVFNSSGFSDITIYARYIALKSNVHNLEFSLGSGLKIPLGELSEWTPQNIQPSTGALAILFNAFVKKYFQDINSGVVLGTRYDINFEDKWNYRYGNSLITSIIYIYNSSPYFNFGMELRNAIRAKDYDKGKITDSGMISFSGIPMIMYFYKNLTLTGFVEYPFYQYFNIRQIANKISVGVNLSYSGILDF